MSKATQPVGFVLPPGSDQQAQQPSYPPQNHNQGYPSYPPQQGYFPQQGYLAQQGHPQSYNYPPPTNYQHQPFPAPIQHQPGFGAGSYGDRVSWTGNSNFRDFLRNTSSFHVKQKVELLEVLTGWETPNRYTVKDQFGNKIFYVGEESSCLARQCLTSCRPLNFEVKDVGGASVLRFDRPVDCNCCFGLCCPGTLDVTASDGQRLGSVEEGFSIFYPNYKIKDAAGNVVLNVEGPLCTAAILCGPVVFRVMTPNGVSVGTISKEWSGAIRELFTDADFFSISFPPDLDPAIKAVCLGCLFLIDIHYFEASGDTGNQGGRTLFG